MRKLLLVIALALTAAAAVALGPGGWYHRGVREATARYHQAYVAAAWPAEDAGIYLGAYIKAHNRRSGGFYSMPKGDTPAQVSPRLVSWGDWTRDLERQYARIHRAGKDMPCCAWPSWANWAARSSSWCCCCRGPCGT